MNLKQNFSQIEHDKTKIGYTNINGLTNNKLTELEERIIEEKRQICLSVVN